jgi:rod shape-determining protein MreD
LLLFAALLQSTVLPLFRVAGVKPDLVLLIVISWSLLRGSREGIRWGFLGGLCLDLFSGAPLGASSVGLMTASLLTGQGETNIFRGNVLLPVLFAPVGTVVYYGALLIIFELTGQSQPIFRSFGQIVLPAAIMNAATIPFVHIFMRWLDRRLARPQVNW